MLFRVALLSAVLPAVAAVQRSSVLDIVHSALDATGAKQSESGIWLFDHLLPQHVVSYVLAKLPSVDSPSWGPCPTGCPDDHCSSSGNMQKEQSPADDSNSSGRLGSCFKLPIEGDAVLLQVVDKFKSVWGRIMDVSEMTHLAIQCQGPAIPEGDLHQDCYRERQSRELPTVGNLIYLTEQAPEQSEEGQLLFPSAGVTITPRSGSMVSFAITDDNDHLVTAAEGSAMHRIFIQVPVSVSDPSRAVAYGEFMGPPISSGACCVEKDDGDEFCELIPEFECATPSDEESNLFLGDDTGCASCQATCGDTNGDVEGTYQYACSLPGLLFDNGQNDVQCYYPVSGVAGCNDDKCCKPATCGDTDGAGAQWSCTPVGLLFDQAEVASECAAAGCTDDLCCKPATCGDINGDGANWDCPAKYALKTASTKCAESACTDATCCKRQPKKDKYASRRPKQHQQSRAQHGSQPRVKNKGY